tara:strand:- start:184 stop:552 length:369 start_codon:yes stop_codon:yes gene_type:complete
MTHQPTHARRRRRDDDDASKTTPPTIPPPPNAPFRNLEDDFVGVDGLDHHRHHHPSKVVLGKEKMKTKIKREKMSKMSSFAQIGLFFSATLLLLLLLLFLEDDIFASIRGTIEEEDVVKIKV